MPPKMRLKSKRKKSNDLNRKKQKMSNYLIKGLKTSEAALLAGVSKTELAEMRCDGGFEDLIQLSQAKLEAEHLDNISDAGSMGAWQASAWFLERLFPEKYGKKDTIEHKYEIKMVTFQNVVLEVINECSPQLKQVIMQKLKKADLNSLPAPSSDKSERTPRIIDIN